MTVGDTRGRGVPGIQSARMKASRSRVGGVSTGGWTGGVLLDPNHGERSYLLNDNVKGKYNFSFFDSTSEGNILSCCPSNGIRTRLKFEQSELDSHNLTIDNRIKINLDSKRIFNLDN